ncbi:hypothetical protein VI817_003154 [Penicillium citrinum]|nr:hypothetical protein VI817_003154 [Penicillium citrinum]
MFSEEIQKKLDERKDNTICYKQLTSAILRNYENTVLNWVLLRLSRNKAANTNFSKEEPDSIPQLLKSFAEDYIATKKKLFLQKSIGSAFAIFIGSDSRVNTVVESSDYFDINKYLYYRICFGLSSLSSKNSKIKYWMTIDPEFLKGQIIIPDSSLSQKILIFLSLQYNFITKISEAIHGQILNYQNYNIYIKYQSVLKFLDIQILNTDKIKIINERIYFLISQISNQSLIYPDLDAEYTNLYSKKSKLYLWIFIYNKYISGNKFAKHNKISLFQIFKKYLPEYIKLRDSLFSKNSLNSNIGQQYLDNIIKLCTNTDRQLLSSLLLVYIEKLHSRYRILTLRIFICPYPCCQERDYYSSLGLHRHFFDVHSIEEPCSNYVKRKQKWQKKLDLELEIQAPKANCFSADIQENSVSENNNSLTSFEGTNAFDMERLMEEFTYFDNHRVRCRENSDDIQTTDTHYRIGI